jgi:hypothetical protein
MRCMFVALSFLLIDARPYWLATILVAANYVWLASTWNRPLGFSVPPAVRDRARRSGPVASAFSPIHANGALLLAIAVTVTLMVLVADAWLREILTYPVDPQRADMLIVIRLGIRRLLHGHNPYVMYHLPWDVTLPYGPVLWAPFIVADVLHADLRFVTMIGALFIPAACSLAIVRFARNRDWSRCLGLLLVLAAIVVSPDLTQFMSIGHTPAYWPLLPLLAYLVDRDRWIGAAVVCGLLIAARSTMIAIAPVLIMAAWRGRSSRRLATAACLGGAIVLPFLPFAVADWRALAYALYGSYQTVIKGFVWTSTEWAQHTIGVTGPLLAHGRSALVEPVQIAVMLLVYAVSWLAIRGGKRPLPWMVLSLFAFSATTLWPVIYLYFDVLLLLVAATLAELVRGDRIGPMWLRTFCAASGILLVVAFARIPAGASIDVGSNDARRFLYSGFSRDERDQDRTFAWVNGTHAMLLVPARSRHDATIHITCEPFLPLRGVTQHMTATLNGIVLGDAQLRGGWQTVSLAAPPRVWQIGVNALDLFFSSAASPRDVSGGNDARQLTAAIDAVTVAER